MYKWGDAPLFKLSDVVSIISALGVCCTLILGFLNLSLLKYNQRQSQEYNLRLLDFEKRREIFLSIISDYIAVLCIDKIPSATIRGEFDPFEFEDKLSSFSHDVEKMVIRIKLELNASNSCYSEILAELDAAQDLIREFCFRAAEISVCVFLLQDCSKDSVLYSKEYKRYISLRDAFFDGSRHMKIAQQELINTVHRYLHAEKNWVIGGQNNA